MSMNCPSRLRNLKTVCRLERRQPLTRRRALTCSNLTLTLWVIRFLLQERAHSFPVRQISRATPRMRAAVLI